MNISYDNYEIRQIRLTIPDARRRWSDFLSANGLREEPVDLCLGVFDSADRLVATASLCGDIIKEVAIDAGVRDSALTNTLVSRLLTHAFSCGINNVFVFTKPEYAPLFRSLGFHTVSSTDAVVLLESNHRALESYKAQLHTLRSNGRNGVIVLNANPMTLGHLYLIEEAARRVDRLFLLPLDDNAATMFSAAERVRILERATAPIPNVTIVPPGRYAVSASTFPAYFIKRLEDAAEAQMHLDLEIFRQHIAPALGAEVRFVGTEPTDPLTARYNELMHSLLPEVIEIKRLQLDGSAVSASRVRSLLTRGRVGECLPLLPRASRAFLLARAAAEALRSELSLTPKPGLVDRSDNGSHSDMDYAMMQRSIEALEPWLEELAMTDDADTLRRIGIKAEQAMLHATGGVNTHRGALFSLGLTVASAASLSDVSQLQSRIMALAARFPRPDNTHGRRVHDAYGCRGALDHAIEGYPALFDSWLPDYRRSRDPHRLLLLIMSTLDDSNILHRGGPDAARRVKQLAAEALHSSLPPRDSLATLNTAFVAYRLSPGGAADMLALTILIDKIIPLNQP